MKKTKPLDTETKELILRLAKEHCGKVFSYYTPQDVESEVIVICMEALPKFDPKIGILEHFLRRVIKTRLINAFKSATKSVKSPCPRCKHFNADGKNFGCNKFFDEKDLCNKWKNHQLSVNSRNSLLNASEDLNERIDVNDPADRMMFKEISDLIKDKINKDQLKDFYRFIDGQTLGKQKKRELFDEIKQILAENGIFHE